MDNQLIVKMENLILGMFESMLGLRKGYCLPTRWRLKPKIIGLNLLEQDALANAFNELSDRGIIEISDNGSMGEKISITKSGVQHITENKLKGKEMKKNSSNHINISTLKADHVQVGNQNTMNINITPDEFVSLLERLNKKTESEKASVFSKLRDIVKSGTTVMELFGKLKELM